MSKVAGEGVGHLSEDPSLCRVTACNELELQLLSPPPFIHDAKSRLTVSLSQDEEASLTLPPLSPTPSNEITPRFLDPNVSYFVCCIRIEGLLIRWLVFRDWPGFKLLLRSFRSEMYFTFERIFSPTGRN